MKAPATSSTDDLAGGVSLDALFRSNARARPDSPALAGSTKRFSYAEADAAIERLARRLLSFGMPPESVVAVQLPNRPEAVVALLAIMRAGFVPAPVPVPWRRADLVAALAAVQPKASISLSRFGEERPAETMCEAAAELFQLSFPLAFGDDVPDGVIALDRDETEGQPGKGPAFTSSGSQAGIVTFDTAASGFFPAARGHSQWLAAGLAVLLEARIESGDTIVSTLPLNSLAGIGTSLVPWLLSGGVLMLVDGSSSGLTRAESRGRVSHLIGPAAALGELAGGNAGEFASCIAVHRSHRTHARDFAGIKAARVVDFLSIGEQGAVVLKREHHSQARQIPVGPIAAPSSGRAPLVIVTNVQGDRLLLRGPMLPHAFMNGRIAPAPVDMNGFVHTGFRCRTTRPGYFTLDGEPEGVTAIGGLRYGLQDLQARVAKCVPDARVDVVADPVLGERIRIEAVDPGAAAAALRSAGHADQVIGAVGPVTKRRARG